MPPMPPIPASTLISLCVAFGVGLLIGAERERRKGSGPNRRAAGIRTFTVSSVLGALAMLLGGTDLLWLALAFVAGLMLLAYHRSHTDDPGVTTEIALVLSCVLGGLAMKEPALAAGIGAGMALLLASKDRLHQWVSSWMSEHELHDVLVFFSVALIALPLAPNRFMGPWDALNPHALTLLVVLIMGVHGLGYVALRALGPTRGLPLAGFVGGFISSTATIHAMGTRSRAHKVSIHSAVTGAALSNVSTVIQLTLLVGLVTPEALVFLGWPLGLGLGATVGYGLLFYSLSTAHPGDGLPQNDPGHAFDLKSALGFATLLTGILLVSAALHEWLGTQALWPTAALTGLADAHAGALSALSLAAGQKITAEQAVWPVLISLSANTGTKALVAFQSGGWPFAVRVVPGLLALVGSVWVGVLWV
ncbi:MgtC/SapB family protein [Limnohabitans sp. WS1]|uniref:MgtC/SapB family protein n=1 Tax=Limnohabitans sp. WS1 TaxID=1100726 RepID=UPI001304AD9A|nr:MgtC/SapB family protein [Limnohabitans sp. WS1]